MTVSECSDGPVSAIAGTLSEGRVQSCVLRGRVATRMK